MKAQTYSPINPHDIAGFMRLMSKAGRARFIKAARAICALLINKDNDAADVKNAVSLRAAFRKRLPADKIGKDTLASVARGLFLDNARRAEKVRKQRQKAARARTTKPTSTKAKR